MGKRGWFAVLTRKGFHWERRGRTVGTVGKFEEVGESRNADLVAGVRWTQIVDICARIMNRHTPGTKGRREGGGERDGEREKARARERGRGLLVESDWDFLSASRARCSQRLYCAAAIVFLCAFLMCFLGGLICQEHRVCTCAHAPAHVRFCFQKLLHSIPPSPSQPSPPH
jgi:hypothetical protein